ncbi:hypothetical protein E2C01_066612 [Portunus trituberculatus]|uniref:Uncharacterized protein n=1 Tax=Portunus trituberculatus TaxID=210409 RepID=A0A5B7HHK4_PORTR|nr:hypothetical protein [Portunus trituberculatus]
MLGLPVVAPPSAPYSDGTYMDETPALEGSEVTRVIIGAQLTQIGSECPHARRPFNIIQMTFGATGSRSSFHCSAIGVKCAQVTTGAIYPGELWTPLKESRNSCPVKFRSRKVGLCGEGNACLCGCGEVTAIIYFMAKYCRVKDLRQRHDPHGRRRRSRRRICKQDISYLTLNRDQLGKL